ncbi:MAG: helix-turn-helix domain-containing protein [Gemmatimonadales bacterium]
MGKLLGGAALIAVALFMLVGLFNVSRPLGVPAAIATLLFTVALPGAAGIALLRSHFAAGASLARRREDLRRQTQEAEILKLAQEREGKLTVVEVVSRLALPTSTVEQLLAGLHERGLAELEITDAGLLVYRFPDVQHLPGKGTSRDVLDA